jgi:hypothetical protein
MVEIEENRTLVYGLQDRGSTIELYPHGTPGGSRNRDLFVRSEALFR